jgi:hypothetical protein
VLSACRDSEAECQFAVAGPLSIAKATALSNAMRIAGQMEVGQSDF